MSRVTVPVGEIDSAHAARQSDSARVDAHRLGARQAALQGGALSGRRLRSAEHRDVGDARIGGDDRGNRLDAKWNRAESRAGLRIEHGERVVRGERNDRETSAVGARSCGDCWCARHVVAERAGIEFRRGGIAARVRVEDGKLRDRRATSRVRGGARRRASRPTDDASTRCVVGIYREGIDAGAAVDARAGEHAVGAPGKPIHGSRYRRPDLVRRLAESHAADSAVEHGLHAGGRDALSRCDHAGVANVALRSWLLSDECSGGNGDGDDEHIVADATIAAWEARDVRSTVALPLQPPFVLARATGAGSSSHQRDVTSWPKT